MESNLIDVITASDAPLSFRQYDKLSNALKYNEKYSVKINAAAVEYLLNYNSTYLSVISRNPRPISCNPKDGLSSSMFNVNSKHARLT